MRAASVDPKNTQHTPLTIFSSADVACLVFSDVVADSLHSQVRAYKSVRKQVWICMKFYLVFA